MPFDGDRLRHSFGRFGFRGEKRNQAIAIDVTSEPKSASRSRMELLSPPPCWPKSFADSDGVVW